MSNRGEQRESTPKNGTQHNDYLARVPVREGTRKGRSDHVEQKECAGQITNLCIREVELRLHQRLHCEQHRVVNVVEQVQRREQRQSGSRIEFGGGHVAKEYNMPISNGGITAPRQ